jgi:hypothetical protein
MTPALDAFFKTAGFFIPKQDPIDSSGALESNIVSLV